MPFAYGSSWFYIRHCEKARIKFLSPRDDIYRCGPGGRLWIAGYGAGANAEINVRLISENGKKAEAPAAKADENGRWIAALETAQWAKVLGDDSLKNGKYKLFAYQTNEAGFLRESELVNIRIGNCYLGGPGGQGWPGGPCAPCWPGCG
jgi:hypothetical protein